MEPKPEYRSRLLGFLVLLLVVGVLISILLPSIGGGPADPAKVCQSNLQQIHFALAAYRKEFGRFPPRVVRDAQGRAVQSWRTLILPHLGLKYLHENYRRNEPWYSSHNSMLPVPPYICPRDPSESNARTSYLALVQARESLEVDQGDAMEAIGDSASSVIAIIEVTDSGIAWSEPRDVSIEDVTVGRVKLHGMHDDKLHCLLPDGTITSISPDADLSALSRRRNGPVQPTAKPAEQDAANGPPE